VSSKPININILNTNFKTQITRIESVNFCLFVATVKQ